MTRKRIALLLVLVVLNLHTCMLSKSIILDSAPPAMVWDTDFETGLVVKASRQSSPLIWRGPMLTIREFRTREIVYAHEVTWHSYTSIALEPGKYIVDVHVAFLGFRIWKYKGFFEVGASAPSHLAYDAPFLVISKPRVLLR